MKKGVKIWIIAAALLVAVGGILFTCTMTALGWDFSRLSTVSLESAEYDITDDFNGISIVTDTSDIIFIPSEDGKTRVVCREEENARHSVSVNNGILEITQNNSKKWYEHIGFSFAAPKITVYLPKSEYGALKISSETGDINIPKDFKLDSAEISLSTGDVNFRASVSEAVKIKATTGDILFKDVSAGNVDISVSTGDVTLTGLSCIGDVKVKVTTGEVLLKDVTCNALTSSGSTGDIVMKNVIAAEKMSVKRSTGDVELEGCDASEIFIETSTGDVEGTLLSEKQFIVKTDTGERDVPNTVNGGRCEITTDTGDVEIELIN